MPPAFQLPQIARMLQIEPGDGASPLSNECAGKGRLADLTRAEQRHNGILAQQAREIAQMGIAGDCRHY